MNRLKVQAYRSLMVTAKQCLLNALKLSFSFILLLLEYELLIYAYLSQ